MIEHGFSKIVMIMKSKLLITKIIIEPMLLIKYKDVNPSDSKLGLKGLVSSSCRILFTIPSVLTKSNAAIVIS